MLIEQKEVDRFVNLVSDITSGRLPKRLTQSVLLAFFTENPHLLMIERFDEHMQKPLETWEADYLDEFIGDPTMDPGLHFARAHKGGIEDYNFPLPHLEFRTSAGRWAGLVRSPQIDLEDSNDDSFLFSFNARQVLKKLKTCYRIQNDQLAVEKRGDLDEILKSDIFTVRLESLVADLRNRVQRPREQTSVLWSPRLWTPREQTRQRQLLDSSIAPHLTRWKAADICFDDLNPSEFEDLVGEVLLAAGLKIYKVREVPQGGRDLIARGTLIPNEEPIEMAVEVKHRRIVDRPEVQLALYQNRAYPALLFVTSGRFTSGVFKEKKGEANRLRLFLKDGLAIGDLVRTHFQLDAKRAS